MSPNALTAEVGVADRVAWLRWSKFKDLRRSTAGITRAGALLQIGNVERVDDERVGRAVDVSAANYDEAADQLAAAALSVPGGTRRRRLPEAVCQSARASAGDTIELRPR